MTRSAEVWENAFRHHRHDVQNVLQLIKAYIQIGKPDRALSAVDQLAEWLNSLSIQQAAHLPDGIFWALASSSHVRLVWECNEEVHPSVVSDVCACVERLEQFASEHSVQTICVTVRHPESSENRGAIAHVLVDIREDLCHSWHNVHEEMSWQHLMVETCPL